MFAPEEVVTKVRTECGRTIEEILSKESKYDLYEILGAIEVLVGSKISQKLPTSLGERMVFAFKWMVVEVNNGGFHQYLFNSAGDFWQDILSGLTAIGDMRGHQRFCEVLSIFPNSFPATDRFERQNQLSTLDDQDEEGVTQHFERVSQDYYREPFPDWPLLYAYVKTHPREFDLSAA